MKQDAYIRQSFYGGRSEIFQPICETKSYYYDINSLYPFIMKTMPLPIGKLYIMKLVTLKRIALI